MEAQLFEALSECEFGRHLDVRIGVDRLTLSSRNSEA